jgi:DNA-binding transcriptional ArsR family regulator
MKDGPDIALIGSLIGDPARANMLTALVSGKALTASELAGEAGVTLQTASSHLGKLTSGGLVTPRKQGRHRYFSLADDHVAGLLETMMGIAAEKGHVRVRTGPKDPALRQARVCYNHLAGEFGVRIFDSARNRGFLTGNADGLHLSKEGVRFFSDFGIDIEALAGTRRPLCKACLDWSARRNHMAGALGTALLQRFYDTGWARREENSRVVNFKPAAIGKFERAFPL